MPNDPTRPDFNGERLSPVTVGHASRWEGGQAQRMGRENQVHDQFDVSLEDHDLLGEVELTTNLMVAASGADEHLSVDEIDRILGVLPEPRRGA